MSRPRALVPLLAATLVLACTGNAPPPVKRILADDRQENVDLLALSRASAKHVGVDLRESWTQVLDQPLEITLTAQGEAKLATAALLIAPKDTTLPENARVTFELVWKGAGKDEVRIEKVCEAEKALHAWVPFDIDLKQKLEKRSQLVLIARGGADLPKGLRVAWSVPEVPGYFGAPLSAEKRAESTKRPNVLLLSIDTLRPDHLRCFGYGRDTSPNIDKLAEKSVVFEQALTQAPWTLPSYGSLFTGLDPSRHYAGFVPRREKTFLEDKHEPMKGPGKTSQPLLEGVPTLAQLLGAAGWQTAGFTNNPFLAPTYGLDRGFQRYVGYEYNAAAGVELARDWIVERDRPWFCFVHVMDPHQPYAAPEPWDAKFSSSPLKDHPGWPPSLGALRTTDVAPEMRKLLVDYYDAEIAFADDQLGWLLRELDKAGALKDTIIVFHSDHGEELWDHGGFEHGHTLYQELLHVPVFLRWDGHLKPGRVKARMRAYDLFPTLLELCGHSVPANLDAQSLMPWLDGREPAPADRDASFEFMLWGDRELKGRIVGTKKFVMCGTGENHVYDLATDHYEQHDLAEGQADFARAQRAALAERYQRSMANKPKRVVVKLSEGEIQRIDQAGYTGKDDEEPAPGAGTQDQDHE